MTNKIIRKCSAPVCRGRKFSAPTWLASLLLLFLAAACTQTDDIAKGRTAEGRVKVRFQTGSADIVSRSDFADNAPARLFIFQRGEVGAVADTADYLNLWKTVDGTAIGTALIFPEDVTIDAGYVYDFAVEVSNNPDTRYQKLYDWRPHPTQLNILYRSSYNEDLLFGRERGVAVPADSHDDVVITFKDDAIDGKLPHLTTAIDVVATATPAMIAYMNDTVGAGLTMAPGNLTYPAPSANGRSCISFFPDKLSIYVESAWGYYGKTLPLAGNPSVKITAETVRAFSKPAFTTPSYAHAGNLTIVLVVNDVPLTMTASNVKLPAFEAGKRHTFFVKFDKDPFATYDGTVELSLVISDWGGNPSWNSEMGLDGTLSTIQLGSWKTTIDWNSILGLEGQNSTITISDWKSVNWNSPLGN